MSKHVLDRPHSRFHSLVLPYAAAAQRQAPEGSSYAAQYLIRRRKGPLNSALRTQAFLRIDRGQEA
ncbi:hypothetical protein [Tropicimonas sp. IMCC6043]|uniref:hypothetical protein n=1 Tax=Tropicimonas sp. IMCC6043 TaxID=2510645 RepID=UPI00101CE170|nr:hypothetical protein [Tropicimonas sp. IMCC6043]RYH09971.1 hypothetical protein EU800_10510 [Tropicimonas sp. IMCC6043]